MPRNTKILTKVPTPNPEHTGYEQALINYFTTYRSNPITFLTVNFSTVDSLVLGMSSFPARFSSKDVLAVMDAFFRNDGTISPKLWSRFETALKINTENKYALRAQSERLQNDLLAFRIANRRMIPHVSEILHKCKTYIRREAASGKIPASRILPALLSEIDNMRSKNYSMREIATNIHAETTVEIHHQEVARFIRGVESIRKQFLDKGLTASAPLPRDVIAKHRDDENSNAHR